MQANTESQARRRRQAYVSAAVSALWQLLYAGLLLWLRRAYFPSGILSVCILALAIADLVMLVPLAVSLYQRTKEIEGGEEDEARQY